MRGKGNIVQRSDWALMVLYLMLVLIGWLNIFATTHVEGQSIFSLANSSGKQLLWMGTSLVLAWMILMVDGRFFNNFAWVLYVICILTLVGVLLFGTEIKGARSWFSLGETFRLQPSEFAKWGTALAVTRLLSAEGSKIKQVKTRFKAFFIIILPAVLIALQPDPGSALIYLAFIFVLYREGLSGNFLLMMLGAAVFFIIALITKHTPVSLPFGMETNGLMIFIGILTGIAALAVWAMRKYKRAWLVITGVLALCVGYVLCVDYVFDNMLAQRHQNRLNELLGITFDPTGTGYNVHQSKIAIGSGGFTGKGFLQGTQTKFEFVPEQTTDFIFCTIGEEWGFLGSFVVVVLFIILLFRIIIVAERQRSRFARVFGYCVMAILFFHFTINIGMTLGLAPVIGIPLPFFSYGGSSLMAFTMLLFTFIKLDAGRMDVLR